MAVSCREEIGARNARSAREEPNEYFRRNLLRNGFKQK